MAALHRLSLLSENLQEPFQATYLVSYFFSGADSSIKTFTSVIKKILDVLFVLFAFHRQRKCVTCGCSLLVLGTHSLTDDYQ